MTRDPQLARLLRALVIATMVAIAAPVTAFAAEATPEPTAEPTPEPTTTASILIVNIDTRGTDDEGDDTLLDGAVFEVYADDGDGAFDPGGETLVDGPTDAPGGMVDTADLPAGRYWIVQSTFPAGYMGAAPFLVELNLDGSVSCLWTAHGLQECDLNDQGSEHLSWTIAIVDNHPLPDPVETSAPTDAPTEAPTDAPAPTDAAPTDPPTGGVAGATGTPGNAGLTLPPTDVVAGGASSGSDAGARMAVVLLAAAALAAALLAPRRSLGRRR